MTGRGLLSERAGRHIVADQFGRDSVTIAFGAQGADDLAILEAPCVSLPQGYSLIEHLIAQTPLIQALPSVDKIGWVRTPHLAPRCRQTFCAGLTLLDREIVQRVSNRLRSELRLVASPLKLSATPVNEPAAPPRLEAPRSNVPAKELGCGAHHTEALTGQGPVKQQTLMPAR